MAIGLLLCAIFVAVSFFARQQPQSDAALVKADKLTRTAGNPAKAN